MRAIIFSHGHPAFSKGGGELAAHYLFDELNGRAEHEAWFIGRGQPEIMPKFSSLALVADREYLMAGNAGIAELTATTPLGRDSDLAQLLTRIQPDVVHFHHYVHLGIETIRVVKKACPAARIVLTLHEFIAICLNNGQMVKTDGRLCHQYSPKACHLCFPEVNHEDVFLRERYIKRFFKLVDRFISPSDFLKQRYVAWGLPADRIHVIENGLPPGERLPPRPLFGDDQRTRFAYFGQINPYKGVDLILEAFAALPKSLLNQVTLDIFGSALEKQAPDYQKRMMRLLKQSRRRVHLHGPYEPDEMGRLMAEVDWVVMGSIWWENSPLVIQEAFKYGRPVICPDIGGMAEKVQPGIGGLHYRARDPVSLAGVIRRIVAAPDVYRTLQVSLPDFSPIEAVVDQHLNVYRGQ